MYPIYLLEDNELQRNKYAEFIHNGILINDANMTLEVAAGTVDDFFKQYDSKRQALYFLDMEILDDKIAGLKIAERVRQNSPLSQIVFYNNS